MLPVNGLPLRRILVVRLDNIGDVVMTGPFLRALACAYPQAEITLMASPAGTQAAPLLPWIANVITWRASWQDISQPAKFDPQEEQRLVDLLREQVFDAAFILTSFSQSPYPPAYICALAGIPVRVGQSKEFGGALLTHWVQSVPDDSHQVDRSLHLLDSVGIPLQGRKLELSVPDVAQQRAEALLADRGIRVGAPFIAVAPGASCSARRYPEERFAAAVRGLADAAQIPVVVLGSQREAERLPHFVELAQSNPLVNSLLGETNVPELAAVIANSSLVLANNSSSLHLADAFRRPMVILYSGTEFLTQWQPRSAPAELLYRNVSCSPCFRFECPYQLECLDIAPGQVVQAGLDLLAQTVSRTNPTVSGAG